MDLIERYLQAVGRALPRKKRADILTELRSALYDSLDSGSSGQADEATAVDAIKAMGPPRSVAASYYPEGQYLIGPALFPLFQMVVGVVVAAVLGGQLLALIISALTVPRAGPGVLDIVGVFASLPAAVGWVVVVFWMLQRAEVNPDEQQEFDPRSLPPVEPVVEPVKRGEQLIGIVFSVVFLVLLARFAQTGAFTWFGGQVILENPVVVRYFPWIAASMLLSIGIDILVLWRGHWHTALRIGAIAANLFSLAVIGLLLQGHNDWLAAAGMPGLFESLGRMPELLQEGQSALAMVIFRLALTVAAIVVIVETVVLGFRLVRAIVAGPDLPREGSLRAS
jgi:uncharacterized membrane protein